MSSNTDKQLLRAQLIKQRKSIAQSQALLKSQSICQNLSRALDTIIHAKQQLNCTTTTKNTTHDKQPIHVGVYTPLPFEVDINDFITYAYSQQCTMSFPCLTPKDHPYDFINLMEFREVTYDDYKGARAPFIAHPIKPFDRSLNNALYPLTEPHMLDMLVVPLVGFDDSSVRLGYGGGYYDRYLALVDIHCFVVGVGFVEQHCEHVPCEAHDICLTSIFSA